VPLGRINYPVTLRRNVLVVCGAVLIAIAACLRVSEARAQMKADFVATRSVKLKNPHDLKLSPDSKHLFVSDVGNNCVAILDAETLALVSSFGSDHQSGTHDVDFDIAGRAYLADTDKNCVTIYDMSGTQAKLVGELSERVRGPEGMLAHPNESIYVGGCVVGQCRRL
jgi:DNA-binding beta-propeller fold protein YncE